MKTIIHRFSKAGQHFIIIQIIIFSICGCNLIKEKKISYVISHDSVYLFHNGFLLNKPTNSGITSTGEFAYIVKQQKTYPFGGRDTVSYDAKVMTDSNDSSFYQDRFSLYLNEPITIKQLLHYFSLNDIPHLNLNEQLYQFCMLSHSSLKAAKNQFGDIEGYYVETPHGEFVPNEYFRIEKASYIYKNEPFFVPNEIEIGRIEWDNNYLSFSLTICKEELFEKPRFPNEITTSNIADKSLKNKSSGYFSDIGSFPLKNKKYNHRLITLEEWFNTYYNTFTKLDLKNQGLKCLPDRGYTLVLSVQIQARKYYHPNYFDRKNYSAFEIFNIKQLSEN